MNYKLGPQGQVQYVDSGAWIPATWIAGTLTKLDADSPLVKAFEDWLNLGNQPLPADTPTPAAVAEAARQASFDAAIAADPNLQQFKTMDKAAFDAWWAVNVTNATQAIGVLKKLTWLLIRYVLH